MIDLSWDIISERFAGDPASAFILAQSLFVLKEAIKGGPDGALSAIEALEQGIKKLYPYTDSHVAAYKLYLLALAGNLKPKHDPIIIARET